MDDEKFHVFVAVRVGDNEDQLEAQELLREDVAVEVEAESAEAATIIAIMQSVQPMAEELGLSQADTIRIMMTHVISDLGGMFGMGDD
jgi:hypothetical protein